MAKPPVKSQATLFIDDLLLNMVGYEDELDAVSALALRHDQA